MKNFLLEYFAEFKLKNIEWSCENEPGVGGALFFPMIWICSFCGAIYLNCEEVSDMIVFFSLSLPAVLTWISVVLHRSGREKMFYLLPMDKEERLKKIKGDYRNRTIIHMIFFLTGLVPVVIFGHPWVLSMLLMVLMDIVFSSLLYFREGEKGFIENIVLCLTYLIILFWQLVLMTNSAHGIWQDIILYFIFLIVVLPTFVHYQTVIGLKFLNSMEYREVDNELEN